MRLNNRVWRLERRIVADEAVAGQCPRCHGLKFVTVVFDESERRDCPVCGNAGVRVVVTAYQDDPADEAVPASA